MLKKVYSQLVDLLPKIKFDEDSNVKTRQSTKANLLKDLNNPHEEVKKIVLDDVSSLQSDEIKLPSDKSFDASHVYEKIRENIKSRHSS